HRVLLLERERFPRHQIGESLLPATVHGICTLLGVKGQLERAKFVRKNGGTFLWGLNQKPWSFGFSISPVLGDSAGFAYQVERAKFDQILLENARLKGVTIQEEAAVKRVISENGRVSGVEYTDDRGRKCTARARFVADASGNQSVIARNVGDRVFSKFFQNVALYCYFENGKRLPPPNHGNILCATFNQGWFWYIPLSDKLTSVGAVIGHEHAHQLKGGYEQAMRAFIDSCPIINEYLAGATRVTDGIYGAFRVRKDYSYSSTRFWRPGMVLVGDAACFVDPVFSSGVHLATYAGLLAARSINTVLNGAIDEARCFQEFESRYRREFSNFYQFLIAFYDINQDEESYFWHARKVLNTSEKANEAFVRLVAGVSEPDLALNGAAGYFEARKDIGRVFDSAGNTYVDALDADPAASDFNSQTLINDLLSEAAELQALGRRGSVRKTEKPAMPGGLIASPDGFRWREVPASEV
ncbi:MAG TPA: tryptophan 7-halogenase, partial [Bryobacteraceae bacterium]